MVGLASSDYNDSCHSGTGPSVHGDLGKVVHVYSNSESPYPVKEERGDPKQNRGNKILQWT